MCSLLPGLPTYLQHVHFSRPTNLCAATFLFCQNCLPMYTRCSFCSNYQPMYNPAWPKNEKWPQSHLWPLQSGQRRMKKWPHNQGGCLTCWCCKIDSRFSWDCTDLSYARNAQGVLPIWGWGCDQSIGSTFSDAIVSSWLWLPATGSSPLGYLIQ